LTARVVFRDSTGAVRPPWRLLAFVAASLASLIVINGAVVPLVSGVLAMIGVRLVLFPWALLGAVMLAHAITFRLVDPRGWRSVRLDRSAARLRPMLTAAVLGAGAVALATVPLLAIGWLRIVPGPEGSSIGGGLRILPFLAPAALWEEMVFRGYGFAVLAEWWGIPAALGVTSLAFGLVHLENAGATVGSVSVVVIAGLFLGGVLVAMRSLWAAFTAHLAWNWTLAGVLHSAVSGVPFATPDYRVVDAGPDWATGGVWGPEGGLPAALSLLAVTIYLYARRTRREES
jgi:membrane protease YdiL (CAAX protease family)